MPTSTTRGPGATARWKTVRGGWRLCLANAGVRREERVLLLMLDTSDWPVAFLGCLYAGVVPVAVNTPLKPDDYA